MPPSPGHHVARRLHREPHLLGSAQQHHIGQRGLDRIADAALAFGVVGVALWRWLGPHAQLTGMARVHRQIAGEGAPSIL